MPTTPKPLSITCCRRKVRRGSPTPGWNIAVGDIIHRAEHRRFRPLHHRRHRLGVGAADHILKTSQHADDAKAFIDYVLSPEGQARVADAWLMPARRDVAAKRPLGKITFSDSPC
jgi:ABC-type uncharacterized transport system YnjBCD substrate-binding protein